MQHLAPAPQETAPQETLDRGTRLFIGVMLAVTAALMGITVLISLEALAR